MHSGVMHFPFLSLTEAEAARWEKKKTKPLHGGIRTRDTPAQFPNEHAWCWCCRAPPARSTLLFWSVTAGGGFAGARPGRLCDGELHNRTTVCQKHRWPSSECKTQARTLEEVGKTESEKKKKKKKKTKTTIQIPLSPGCCVTPSHGRAPWRITKPNEYCCSYAFKYIISHRYICIYYNIDMSVLHIFFRNSFFHRYIQYQLHLHILYAFFFVHPASIQY